MRRSSALVTTNLQDHLTGLAILDHLDGLGDLLEWEAVGDHWTRIQLASPQEPKHLVPGLIHLPSGYSVEGQAFEDYVAREIHFCGSAGRTQQIDSPTHSCRGKSLGVTTGVAAHFADQVYAIPAGKLPHPGHNIVVIGIQSDLGTHGVSQFEPLGVEIAGDHQGSPGGTGHTNSE